jgi:DNA-binding sugar fermentation-stimulating protein
MPVDAIVSKSKRQKPKSKQMLERAKTSGEFTKVNSTYNYDIVKEAAKEVL